MFEKMRERKGGGGGVGGTSWRNVVQKNRLGKVLGGLLISVGFSFCLLLIWVFFLFWVEGNRR